MTPILITDRQPTPADCNADGLCWYGEHLGGGRSSWYLTEQPDDADTHWLPAAALPTVPEVDVEI